MGFAWFGVALINSPQVRKPDEDGRSKVAVVAVVVVVVVVVPVIPAVPAVPVVPVAVAAAASRHEEATCIEKPDHC